MSRILGAVALMLICCACAQAAPVDLEQARAVGAAFLEERIDRGDAGRSWSAGECLSLFRDGRRVGFFMPLSPRGHLIISPLTELPAIKAYSFTNDFDPDAAAGYTELVHDVLSGTLDFLEATWGDLDDLPAEVAPAVNAREWERLLRGERSTRDDITVGPVLESTWHQGAPFNNDCPEGDGGTCIVGCVATSGAQILQYWRYPPRGEGSFSYTWAGDTSCGGSTASEVLSAVFYDDYDWENILDDYTGGYSSTEAAAVAELNYEVGVACSMDYGVCASGAAGTVVETIYTDHFRFADKVEHIGRGSHTAATWFARIRAELDALPPRPMHYLISRHSIICDGYRIQDDAHYYHMNYGWGGSQNVWFALDNVYCPWEGCNYLNESMAVGLEPLGYFPVTQPAAGDVLQHGAPLPEVRWQQAPGDSVTLALYRDEELLTLLTGRIANDGVEQPAGTVPAEWGTGANFRIKVLDGGGRAFGWSDPFGIYGAGAWTDVAAGAAADTGDGQSVAWGDYDGDGLDDLYVANNLSANKLLRNLGAGEFADVTAAPLDVTARSRGAAWADIDNDGDPDLHLACTSGGANHLFRNDDGAFADISDGSVGDTSYSMDAAWGDYDGDGHVDLYVVNVYAPDRLLRNVDGLFTDVTAPPLGDGSYCRSANWCDYDDDGDADLFLVRSTGGVLYRNDGDGFAIVAGTPLGDNCNGYGAAWADMDNDGDLDLYQGVNGVNRLLRNDGGGAFSEVTTPILADAGDCRGVAWGDYDNDGLQDLYVVNQGENLLLRNTGGGVFVNDTSALIGDAGEGNAAAWADMDNDGDLDLYLVNADGANRLFRNDLANGNHWLHLDLTGNRSNRSAIGARVTLWTAGAMQTRQVGGDAGYASQNSLRVEFGLGAATTVDSLRVDWPGGGSQMIDAPAVDQVHEIVEEVTTVVVDGGSPPFRLAANYPNPFNPVTEIRFSLSEPGEAALTIHDAAGALVRTLALNERLSAGEHVRIWDGRDDAGRSLSSGVYFCRLTAGSVQKSRKMTLLK